MSDSKQTTDHSTIKSWAEERDGYPAVVESTSSDSDTGIVRIAFPKGDSDDLEKISWDEFFKKFEDSNLALVYQEETSDGDKSRFCKLVSR